jgi:hypothetical protein
MVIIKNAGHFAFVTNRQRFIEEIETFMKELNTNSR